MTRCTALSCSLLLLAASGTSLVHADHLPAFADFDLQFGNLTAVDPADDTFSVDVQMTVEPGIGVMGYQMDFALDGLELQSIDWLWTGALWSTGHGDATLLSFDLAGSSPIVAAPAPVGLFRMNLAVTDSTRPASLTLSDLLVTNYDEDWLVPVQDSYTLTIPAPATLALLAGGLGGLRRRRAG